MGEYRGEGWGRAELLLPGRGPLLLAEAPNTWVYSWGHIAARLAAAADPAFRPAYVYAEFKNVADPADSVPIPVVARQDGLSYYAGLASSSDTDYLRLPIVSRSLDADPNYSGSQYLDSGQVNRLIVEALTAGTAGVHGKVFGNAANSKVYGFAIAAAPTPNDPTQDVVWNRSYYALDQQFIAPQTGTLRLTAALLFK